MGKSKRNRREEFGPPRLAYIVLNPEGEAGKRYARSALAERHEKAGMLIRRSAAVRERRRGLLVVN